MFVSRLQGATYVGLALLVVLLALVVDGVVGGGRVRLALLILWHSRERSHELEVTSSITLTRSGSQQACAPQHTRCTRHRAA